MNGFRRISITPAVFACFLLMLAHSVGTTQPPVDGSSLPDVPSTVPLNGSLAPNGVPAAGAAALVGAAGDMIGFSHNDALGTQTITLVNTGKSWMAVYHIDRSGKIRLVSSRAIDADFSLQLNATSPLPEEIRKMGQAR